ncbi:MAG: lysophospholipase [Bacilli bacterium]|nr:lysophospholipase [Bacilli bacterium]
MLLTLIVGLGFRKALSWRGDGLPHMHYFTPAEYGVEGYEPFEFKSCGYTLRGAKYFVPGVAPKAIVIFFHGIGAGHTAYSHEIAEIAKQGYTVFAYDNRGSMLSEGRSIESIATVAPDQSAFFEYLDTREDAKGFRRYAIGHSWGGYAALMALRKEFRVEKVVSLAGFYSAVEMAASSAPALAKFKGAIAKYSRKRYGKDSVINTIDLMKGNPDKKVLYIQGDHDGMVKTEENFDVMKKALVGCDNVSFLLVKDRAHNCYLSKRAEKYYLSLNGKGGYFTPYRDLDYIVNYDLLMEQDADVMKAIFDFFEN